VTNPAPAGDTRPPNHCIKCGREIGPDESICVVCNRAGMVTPSASQYHGTMVVAIIAGVVGLAIWASLSMRDAGPYAATVVSLTPAGRDAAAVTVEVENQGSGRGTPSCRLEAHDAAGRPLRSSSLQTSSIEGGASAAFTARLTGLSEQPDEVAVSCR
jgi:predicted nucleic acid-binding Zn ribbon protein